MCLGLWFPAGAAGSRHYGVVESASPPRSWGLPLRCRLQSGKVAALRFAFIALLALAHCLAPRGGCCVVAAVPPFASSLLGWFGYFVSFLLVFVWGVLLFASGRWAGCHPRLYSTTISASAPRGDPAGIPGEQPALARSWPSGGLSRGTAGIGIAAVGSFRHLLDRSARKSGVGRCSGFAPLLCRP